MISFFHEYLYIPIYNLLIYLVGVLPGKDIGLAVVCVTLIVKFLTLPLSLSAVRTQRAMRTLQPKIDELKETYKDDKQKQAEAMFALYKEHSVRPFSSMLGMLIQIPVLLCLFFVFQRESMIAANTTLLYPFVSDPGAFSALFLGFFVLSGHNIILAALAGVTQFIQARLAIPVPPASKDPLEKGAMGAEFGRAMAMQARYVLPIVIALVAYFGTGAIALYFITSNIFGILQELFVRRKKAETV